MGYLSKITGQSIDRVIQSGQGLSFIVYPYAVTTLPAAPVWAILFFVMMLLLGMDTMVFKHLNFFSNKFNFKMVIVNRWLALKRQL